MQESLRDCNRNSHLILVRTIHELEIDRMFGTYDTTVYVSLRVTQSRSMRSLHPVGRTDLSPCSRAADDFQ
jgi:hypothetical protein